MGEKVKKRRTGKHQFMLSIERIRDRLEMGETQNSIYDDMNSSKEISISYSQFSRYIRSILYANEKTKSSTNEQIKTKKNTPINNETVSQKEVTFSTIEWNNINVRTERLIADLEKNGISPDEVTKWGLSSDTAIRKKLTEMLIRNKKD